MLTEDDVKKIGVELGHVIEQNVTPALDTVLERLDSLDQRFNIMERKLDSVLVNDVDRHEREIKFLADKVGVELSR